MVQEILLGLQKPWLDDQAKSRRPKTVNSVVLLLVIQGNPASNTWWVSGELGIPLPSVIHHFHHVGKSIRIFLIVPNVFKILQNFWLILVRTHMYTITCSHIHIYMCMCLCVRICVCVIACAVKCTRSSQY